MLKLELALSSITNDLTNTEVGVQALLQARVLDGVFLDILKEATLRPPGLLFPAMPEYFILYKDFMKVVARPTTLLRTTVLSYDTFMNKSGRHH